MTTQHKNKVNNMNILQNIDMTKVQFYQHDDAIKWKHFPHYWPFVLGIHRSPVNTPHKGRWRGALMFNLICAWTNGWANNWDAGDLRRDRGHFDAIPMKCYAWHVHDGYDKYTELLRCPLGYLLIVYNWISWLIRHICSTANCVRKTCSWLVFSAIALTT